MSSPSGVIYVSLNTAVVHSHYCFERYKKYNNVITANSLSIYGMLIMQGLKKIVVSGNPTD